MSRRSRLTGGPGWAVVTGASSGIGAALAAGLARRGYRLWLVARRKDRLEELAERLRTEHGTEVAVRACDLADRAERAELCRELETLDVSVLCSNAGFTTCGSLAECDPAREAAEVELNAVALHQLVLTVLPGMLAKRAGSLVITGSTAGLQPVPTAATYSATKAFANTFAEALSGELRGTGVTCTLLAPGPVKTEFMTVGGAADLEERRWFAWQTPETVAEVALREADRGSRVAIPGFMAKVQALSGRHLPHGFAFLLMRWVILPRMRAGTNIH
ncbi:SDR family NAD(P)-dependent oxidoreductase [Streptomyces hoynatensis]|uniref:SDR family oxidoreductase n=1 Tax=Streptomyces hoynatensis TaxID=1141874 RepID=A0A3A9YVB0_9ACTN|nr:SDR family oxidoreductase [Streptomyces hoynatensis]RKN39514.1 SDR family oxidoreductase [Streptomyces hoynatensis]